MTGIAHLLASEDNWQTAMGAWFPGERAVLRGKDLFKDFKDENWIGLLLYAITGRTFSQAQCRMLDGFWRIGVSYPDPRLWVNRVASLCGTTRSTAVLGTGAAITVAEATIYGHRTNIRTIDTLFRIQKQLDDGLELKTILTGELKEHRAILGYGRPITPTDERIAPTMALATELGLHQGKYIQLAFVIEEFLLNSRYRMHMNIGAVGAGLAADMGLSCREYYHYMALSFSAGILPCFIDAAEKPEGSFFPLRCDRIHYSGKARRHWKDSAATTKNKTKK